VVSKTLAADAVPWTAAVGTVAVLLVFLLVTVHGEQRSASPLSILGFAGGGGVG